MVKIVKFDLHFVAPSFSNSNVNLFDPLVYVLVENLYCNLGNLRYHKNNQVSCLPTIQASYALTDALHMSFCVYFPFLLTSLDSCIEV